MPHRCAVIDDYQNVAKTLGDWSRIPEVEVTVFNDPIGTPDDVARALKDFDIVCIMRERTPFLKPTLDALPKLKLLITTGGHNRSIDLPAAAARGITVCGTGTAGTPTVSIAIGLILEASRRIGFENARMKTGAPWQVTLGTDVEGQTLGILGLGKLGTRIAEVGKALRMKPIAWSQNLTPEKAQAAGVEYVTKDKLFQRSDFLSIHTQLSDRTRGIVGANELALMKKTATLVNTSRGPIVDETALLSALRDKTIGCAALDVFDVEPLPVDHPFRTLENVILTPHLGYVTRQNYNCYYPDIIDDIRAFLDGKPVRELKAH